jgi:hypothetical protein
MAWLYFIRINKKKDYTRLSCKLQKISPPNMRTEKHDINVWFFVDNLLITM